MTGLQALQTPDNNRFKCVEAGRKHQPGSIVGAGLGNRTVKNCREMTSSFKLYKKQYFFMYKGPSEITQFLIYFELETVEWEESSYVVQ